MGGDYDFQEELNTRAESLEESLLSEESTGESVLPLLSPQEDFGNWAFFDDSYEGIEDFFQTLPPNVMEALGIDWIVIDMEKEEEGDAEEEEEEEEEEKGGELEGLDSERVRKVFNEKKVEKLTKYFNEEEEKLKDMNESLDVLRDQFQLLAEEGTFEGDGETAAEKIDSLVRDLLLEGEVLGGKWLIFLKQHNVEVMWRRIGMAVYNGKLGDCKCCKIGPKSGTKMKAEDEKEYVLAVYNDNYLDKKAVMRIRNELTRLGIRHPIPYKPDIYTFLGIYRNNQYRLNPYRYRC
eukprot:Nk52_evm3s287 gene=Nk52_evmTU3s287